MTERPDAASLDPERTRAFLFQCVRRVASEVHREWRRDRERLSLELGMGADGTPTKGIDKLAEDIILDTLADSDLQLNVLSEECGFIDNGASHTLVCDPIDGTRNATHDVPFFCVALAVGRKSLADVEYALVRNLANDDFFFARKGHGASKNGEPVAVRPPDMNEIMAGAIYDQIHDLTRFWDRENLHLRDMGSSALEMALVASGSFDAFVCHNEFLRITDIAASTLLVREAGGQVYDSQRRYLDTAFDVKARTSVVAVSDPRLLEVVT